MATKATRERALKIIARLRRAYPDVKCSLDYESPFQLLAATVLSAQCTDERVNKVTPALFAKYPDAARMAKAKLADVERLVQSTGFYKNKARALVESAKIIVEKHGGEVPRTMEELTHLRGIGRKTANVILGNAFGLAEGVVVDTHVKRLTHRMGFTKHRDPVKVERDLIDLLPREEWTDFSHLMIFHGRARCTARKPDCAHCEVRDLCPKIGVI
jgi:endonuclease-3